MFNEIKELVMSLVKKFTNGFWKGFADGMIYGNNVNALGGGVYITKK